MESVVERILGVDLQKVSLDQLIEGANRMTQQFRHTSTSPIEELQTPALPPELVPAPYPQFLQQPNFGIPPMPDIDYLPPADQGSLIAFMSFGISIVQHKDVNCNVNKSEAMTPHVLRFEKISKIQSFREKTRAMLTLKKWKTKVMNVKFKD